MKSKHWRASFKDCGGFWTFRDIEFSQAVTKRQAKAQANLYTDKDADLEGWRLKFVERLDKEESLFKNT